MGQTMSWINRLIIPCCSSSNSIKETVKGVKWGSEVEYLIMDGHARRLI